MISRIVYREQHRWLCQVLRGHYQYYGVIFNYSSLHAFKDCVVRLWRKTLGKRSQKGRVTWASYSRLLAGLPLPEPVIHQAWRLTRRGWGFFVFSGHVNPAGAGALGRAASCAVRIAQISA